MASLKSYAAKEGLIAGSRVGRFPWLWWGAGTLAVTIITFGASLAMMSLDESRRESLLAETGPIESASFWLYVLVTVCLVWAGTRNVYRQFRRQKLDAASAGQPPTSNDVRIAHPFLLAICTLCFAVRELDYHRAWTSRDIFKTSFLIDPEIAWSEKAIVLAVLSAIGLVVYSLVRIHRETFRERLAQGHFATLVTLVAFQCLVGSKAIDSGMGSLRRNGLGLGESSKAFFSAVEEISELAAPMLLLLAVAWCLSPASKQAKAAGSGEAESAGSTTFASVRSGALGDTDEPSSKNAA